MSDDRTLAEIGRALADLARRVKRLEAMWEVPNVASWTPSVTQGGAATYDNSASLYAVMGPLVLLSLSVRVTNAPGAGAIAITDLPFDVKTATNGPALGSFNLWDAAPGVVYAGSVVVDSADAGRLYLHCDQATDHLGTNPALTLANGDLITFTAWYERA